ncbi:hypothetical protein L1049_025212 [Liquidambar formosana]|uniref:Uncharacterized protein n=1 Tax=Liquidambar formosana TaxID=63359 RepID=A0AAP0S2N5_LIQFO
MGGLFGPGIDIPWDSGNVWSTIGFVFVQFARPSENKGLVRREEAAVFLSAASPVTEEPKPLKMALRAAAAVEEVVDVGGLREEEEAEWSKTARRSQRHELQP